LSWSSWYTEVPQFHWRAPCCLHAACMLQCCLLVLCYTVNSRVEIPINKSKLHIDGLEFVIFYHQIFVQLSSNLLARQSQKKYSNRFNRLSNKSFILDIFMVKNSFFFQYLIFRPTFYSMAWNGSHGVLFWSKFFSFSKYYNFSLVTTYNFQIPYKKLFNKLFISFCNVL